MNMYGRGSGAGRAAADPAQTQDRRHDPHQLLPGSLVYPVQKNVVRTLFIENYGFPEILSNIDMFSLTFTCKWLR